MCKCGLNHRGWETNLCRVELFKRTAIQKQAATTTPTTKIKAILSRSGKPENTVTVTKQEKASVTVTNRMAELRKRKAEKGMVQVAVWIHFEDVAVLKEYVKELDASRCQVS